MVCSDKVGNVKTVKDKRDILTETDYNELNLVKEKRRAGLRLVTNEYDGNGNLRFLTDARGYRIEQRYNKRDLLETTVYPASADFPETSETRTYDGARNLRTVTDEEQNVNGNVKVYQLRELKSVPPLGKDHISPGKRKW